MRRLGASAILAMAASCAPVTPRARGSSADLGVWLSAEEPSPASTSTRAIPRDVVEPATPAIEAERRAQPRRPPARARIDLSFQQADMTHAFQLLADAGRFNLVVQEGLNGKLSATMRRVDPYDALIALAQANGAEVRYERDVVVVRKR